MPDKAERETVMAKKEKIDPVSELHGKDRTKREAFEWVSTFAQALFGVVIVFTFLIRFVTVDGQSMEKTLHHGDRLIITDVNYTPERGDIVVVHNPAERVFSGPVIKRVIATEGESVRVDYVNRKIFVTGTDGIERELEEEYIKDVRCGDAHNCNEWGRPNLAGYYYYYEAVKESASECNDNFGVIESAVFTLDKGEVFVCGDNRAHSLDSRYVGPVDERQILGKVLVRILPKPSVMNHVNYVEKDGKLVVEK